MNCPRSNYQLINHFPYFFFTMDTYLMMWHLKAKHLFLLYCTVAEWCNTKLKYLTFYNFYFSEIITFDFSKTSRKWKQLVIKVPQALTKGFSKQKKGLKGFQKSFLFWVPMSIQKACMVKLEIAYFIKVHVNK